MAHFLHQFRVDQRNISADLGPDLDQTPLRQFQFRFPERGAADAKLLTQLRFIEFFARFQPGVDDAVDQHPQHIAFGGFMLTALTVHDHVVSPSGLSFHTL